MGGGNFINFLNQARNILNDRNGLLAQLSYCFLSLSWKIIAVQIEGNDYFNFFSVTISFAFPFD